MNILFLCSEELPKFSPEDLLTPVKEVKSEEVKDEPEKLISYIAFMNEVDKINKSSNRLRVEGDIALLSESSKNRTFILRDTIRFKRNALVSGELGCWFVTKSGVEVFGVFPKELKAEFMRVQEYDYITCYAKLLSYSGKITFQITKLLEVEPFDPAADFIEMNQEIDRIHDLKESLPFFKFKDELSTFNFESEGRLAIVTGKMLNIVRDPNNNDVILNMSYGEWPIKIVCHPDHLDVLEDLKTNSRISMSVIYESVDSRKGYRFIRGCMVQLRKD